MIGRFIASFLWMDLMYNAYSMDPADDAMLPYHEADNWFVAYQFSPRSSLTDEDGNETETRWKQKIKLCTLHTVGVEGTDEMESSMQPLNMTVKGKKSIHSSPCTRGDRMHDYRRMAQGLRRSPHPRKSHQNNKGTKGIQIVLIICNAEVIQSRGRCTHFLGKPSTRVFVDWGHPDSLRFPFASYRSSTHGNHWGINHV